MLSCQKCTYTRALTFDYYILVACMFSANELSSSAIFEYADVWLWVHTQFCSISVVCQRVRSSPLSFLVMPGARL